MKDLCTESVLQVLDSTKTNKKWYDDKKLIAGYHSVVIQGEKVLGQRDPEKRLAKVDMDFSDKRVLDVGCSNGGLLHALTEKISFGVGVDFNAKCINAANALKAANERNNIHFYTFDLDKEDLSMLRSFVFGELVDVCLFFNISIWVKRWKQVFSLCSELTTTMLFEAHGNEKQQQEQLNFVKSIYSDIVLLSEQSDDDPTYSKRKMYRCECRIERQHTVTTDDNTKCLDTPSEEVIKSLYEETFPDTYVESLTLFPNTHESTVVDINNDYIVKFPKPKRGVSGLNTERAVTDFMREKLNVAIPALSIHSSHVVLGRYPKLDGDTFKSEAYDVLPEKDKNQLADQLAECIYAFHVQSEQDLANAKVELSPSWQLSIETIEEQLKDSNDPAINALLNEVVRNHKALDISESNKVFGHFDMHGGNILFDSNHKKVNGIIDFGNCKFGDLHQDLSVMNLSSPDFALRIAKSYEQLTGRKLNRLLIQHYTTMFYLNLLAGLKKSKADAHFKYWLNKFNDWYQYLLNDRAQAVLSQRKPVSSLPPHLRKWLASAIMKGFPVNGLRQALRTQGFSDLEITKEVLLVEQHPYVNAGKDIFHTLKKREWLLDTLDSLAKLDTRYGIEIEKRKTPSFETFVKEHYSKHLPVVLTGGVDHWPALTKWTPDFLLKDFGDKEIEVQLGRENDPLYERNSGKHKKRMLMSEFIALINKGESNDHYMTANNTKNSFSSLEKLFEDVGDFGEGYRKKESIFTDNFFWFGPKGTFTPIHHDLTNNMLVQIYGRKKVTLIPAMQVPNLYNDKGVYSAAEYPNFDTKGFPLMNNITPVTFILNPGEAVFIPVGWWHCVESLDVSISCVFTNFDIDNQFLVGFTRC